MSTTSWHAPRDLLAAYAEGRLDAVLGASLERHVETCCDCREAIEPLADLRLLDDAWSGIRTRLESPPPTRAVRLAERVGLPEATGILLSAAASLRLAWLTGSVVALGFALLATLLAAGDALWPFLLVAPLVPVLGVAAAYGGAEEPFEALAVTTPYGRARLVLVRTLGVGVGTLPPAAVLGLFLPGPGWVAAAWLGPALAMVLVLLALAAYIGPWPAGATLALLWCGLVVLSIRRLTPTWPVEATQQAGYLALAVAAVAVLVVRSRRTHKIGVAL